MPARPPPPIDVHAGKAGQGGFAAGARELLGPDPLVLLVREHLTGIRVTARRAGPQARSQIDQRAVAHEAEHHFTASTANCHGERDTSGHSSSA